MNSKLITNYYINELYNVINDYYIGKYDIRYNIVEIESLTNYLLSHCINNYIFKISKNINVLETKKLMYVDYLNLYNDINICINDDNKHNVNFLSLLINNIFNKIKENIMLMNLEYNIKDLALYLNTINNKDLELEINKIENFKNLLNNNKNSKGIFGNYVKYSIYNNLSCKERPYKIEYINKNKDFFIHIINNMYDDIFDIEFNLNIIKNNIRIKSVENLKHFIYEILESITFETFDNNKLLSEYLYNYIDNHLDVLINL